MLVSTFNLSERKVCLLAALSFFLGVVLWGASITTSYAYDQAEIDAACGDGLQSNIDDFSTERIERCLRARGFDPFNSQGVYEHADLPCERAISTLSNKSHAQSDKFCKKVADAHQAIYGYRPYWEACGHPDSVSDQDLKTCARGFFRQYDQWERPSSTLYETEANCNSALAVYRNGYSNGHLGFTGKIYDVKDAGVAIGCERMRRTIATLIPYESDPCYADKLFYKDRLGFFSQCMVSDIQSDSTCQQIRQRYVDKLIAANGGLPHNLTPYDQQIPICSEILTLRVMPFAEEKPVDLAKGESSFKQSAEQPVPLIEEKRPGTNGVADAAGKAPSVRGNVLGITTIIVLFGAVVAAIIFSGTGGRPSSIVDGSTLGRLAKTDDLFLIINKERNKQSYYIPFSQTVLQIGALFLGLIIGYFLLSLITFLSALVYFRVPFFGSFLLFVSASLTILFLIGFLAVAISRSFRSTELKKQVQGIAQIAKTPDSLLTMKPSNISILMTLGARSYMGKYLTSFTAVALVGAVQLLTISIFASNNAIFEFVGWSNSVFIDTITFGIIPPIGPFQPNATNLPFVGDGSNISETNFQLYTVLYKFLMVAFIVPTSVMNMRNHWGGEFRYRGNIFGLSARYANELTSNEFDEQYLIARIRNSGDVDHLNRNKILNELLETAQGVTDDLKRPDFTKIVNEVTKKLSSESGTAPRYD